MEQVAFIKMEGCGNDYLFVDGGLAVPPWEAEAVERLHRRVPALSDRHTGVGGDGVILLTRGERGPVRMRMWNADGSEGLLCLNGLRCAAKAAADLAGAPERFVVETAAGPRPVRIFRDGRGRVHEVEVEAGPPDFRRRAIPAAGGEAELWGERFPMPAGGDLPGYGLSVGNPHLVLWMESEAAVRRAPLAAIGRPLATDPRFPEGVNVHLAARAGDALVTRPWERGAGATRACGSGAVAVFAVARRLGAAPERATVRMPGGEVELREDPDGLRLRGPAREVFRGVWIAPAEPGA